MRPRIHWMLVLLVAVLFACPSPSTNPPPPGPPAPPSPPSPPAPPAPPSPPSPPAPPSPPSTSPSSLDLIDSALTNGQITEETAYTYKVFATFGDQRLPNQYRGADGDIEDSDVLLELAPKLKDFSSQTQDTLAPFLFPPAYAGSWKNPQGASTNPLRSQGTGIRCLGAVASGWESVNDVNGHAKVWYDSSLQGDRDKANQIAFEIDKIWVKLINGLGMKDPIKDDGRVCNGGDDRLDIYLVDMAFHGGTGDANGEAYQDHTFGCRQFPAYLQINRNRSGAGLMSTLAHELMHASQYAYDTKSCFNSYGWIIESTATWAKDYVYPTDNDEHGYAGYFFESPEKSLDDQSTRTGKKVRDYGSYLFFQFLAHTINDDTIRKTWEATERIDSSLGAVDDAISASGGLEKQWPEFAKRHWNLPPMDKKSYKTWDALGNAPNLALDQDQSIDADLNGKLSLEIALKPEVPHLAINYYDFSFSNKPDTRSVLFYNPYTSNPKAHVQALWKLNDGSWTEEDWTPYRFVGLCRDIKAQRITDLVVIISNAEWQDLSSKLPISDPPKFMASSVGCWKYQGTVTMLEHHSSWSGLGRKAVSNFNFELDPFATALDAKHPQIPDSLRAGLNLVMPLSGTNYTFEEHYSTGCSFNAGPVSFPLSRLNGFMFTNAFPELVSSDAELQKWIAQPRRAYTSAVGDTQPITVSVSGGPGCNSSFTELVGGLLLTNDAKNGVLLNPPVAGPNGVLKGTFKASDATFDWTLSPQSQP